MKGICDVCGESKATEYCKICKADICYDCRHNYPARLRAFLKRKGISLKAFGL